MKRVGWNVQRNPASEDLPEDLVPGSDEESDLEEEFEQLSIAGKEKQGEEEQEDLLEDESEGEPEEEEEMKKIDVYLEHGVFDPRNNFGTRSRVNFVAVLDSGVKLDSVEVFIDRNSNTVFLTGEYISTLRIARLRMGDLTFSQNCQQIEACYQTFLNSKSYQQTFKMSGKIPKSIEVENAFVDPETDLPVDDPIYPVKVLPDVLDGTATEAHVVHFYALVVQKESNGNGHTTRSRSFYNPRSRLQSGNMYSPAAPGHQRTAPQGYRNSMPPNNHTRWYHGVPPAPAASFCQQPQARAPAPQARAAPQAHHQVRPPTPVRTGRQYMQQDSIPQAHTVPVVQVSEAPQPEEKEADREDPARGLDDQQPDPFPEVRQAMQQFETQGAAYRSTFSGLASPPTSFAAYSSNTSGVPATHRNRRKKVPKRGLGYVEGHDVHSAMNNADEDIHQHHRNDIEQQSLTPSLEITEILDDDLMLKDHRNTSEFS